MTPDAPVPTSAVDALSTFFTAPADGRDLRDGLDRVVRLTAEAVPGAAAASVTLLRAGEPSSPAWSAPLALTCDQRQYDLGDGPCLHAARARLVVHLADVRTDERFGSYPQLAAELGACSSLSIPLAVGGSLSGALNVYAREPHAFGTDALVLAHAFAAHASVVAATTLAHQLEEAMTTRAVIEQAKGIVMSQRRCSPAEAFRVLVTASTRSNRKLRDIAADVVDAAQHGRG